MAAEFFTPGFCQIAGNAGAEFVIFDMEHGGVGLDVLKAQMSFARGARVTPVVRVPGIALSSDCAGPGRRCHGHHDAYGRDAGAGKNLAKWCRYWPEGIRGLGFGVAHDDYRAGDIVERDASKRTSAPS